MTKHFTANAKKLSRRYNLRILRLNILPICVVLTLLFATIFTGGDMMPVKYYRFVFKVMAACLGYSLITVFIGSVISTIRYNGNVKHTYVTVTRRYLIVSRFLETAYLSPEKADYKELCVIKLDEIEDVYPFKKTVIIAAPAKILSGQTDWLDYTFSEDGELVFEREWLGTDEKLRGGIEIKDMYRYPARIARTIEHACGTSKKQVERRQAFREYMLSVTQSAAYKKARQRIRKR